MITDRPLVAMEAEYGVVGSLFIKPDLIESIGAMVSPTDFYDQDVAEIYTLILAARSAGRPADPVSIADIRHELSSGELTMIRASEIYNGVPSAANGLEYARIVVERSKARKVAEIGQAIIDMASHARPLAGIIADEARHDTSRGFAGGYYFETLSLGPAFLAAFVMAQQRHRTVRHQQTVPCRVAFVEQHLAVGVPSDAGLTGQFPQCRLRQAPQGPAVAEQPLHLAGARRLLRRRIMRVSIDKCHLIPDCHEDNY